MSDTQNGPLSVEDLVDSLQDREAAPEAEETETLETEPEESEEVEEAPEEDTETDETDEPEPEEDGPEVYDVSEYGEIAVKLDDGTQTTLSDLAKGTLRQADYTRKTTELSKSRKELEEKEQALADRERQLNEQIASFEEQEPDWEALAEEDPLSLPLKQIEWQKKQAKKAEARTKAEQAAQEQREAFRRQTAEIAVQAMPEWSDGKAFESTAEDRKRAALNLGFTEQEYAQAIDFRLAALLEKAARYDAGQAKVKSTQKKLSKVPKVVKPGSSVTKSEKAQAERAAKAKLRNRPMNVDQYLRTFEE